MYGFFGNAIGKIIEMFNGEKGKCVFMMSLNLIALDMVIHHDKHERLQASSERKIGKGNL